MLFCPQEINMDHQQLASSPAFAFLHGQLSMVLAGSQQLPDGWQQQEEFKSLLQRALLMLSGASSVATPSEADTGADTSDDKIAKQRQLSSDQDKTKQPQQQKQHQQDLYAPLDTTAADDYTAAAAAVEAHVNVLASSSSSAGAKLQALHNLAASVEDEYAEVQQEETPVRSAVCAAGGLNHLLGLITAVENSSSSNVTTSDGTAVLPDNNNSSTNSSMEVAIAAAQLLLALTECRGGSHRYCNNWAHHYIAPAAVPALVRLLLFRDAIAKRSAELLASLAHDAGRHADIAAAGGIAGLLHVLSDASLASTTLVGKAAAALSRPYAVLAAAAAALEALIVDGPMDVQVAIAEAGGVVVLEAICEHLVRQKLNRQQQLGASKKQQAHGVCRSCAVVAR
jgi:hypothetical protein